MRECTVLVNLLLLSVSPKCLLHHWCDYLLHLSPRCHSCTTCCDYFDRLFCHAIGTNAETSSTLASTTHKIVRRLALISDEHVGL